MSHHVLRATLKGLGQFSVDYRYIPGEPREEHYPGSDPDAEILDVTLVPENGSPITFAKEMAEAIEIMTGYDIDEALKERALERHEAELI